MPLLTSIFTQCSWNATPDKRLTVSKQAYEQANFRINTLESQLKILQERLRQGGLPEDVPDTIDSSDDGPQAFFTNGLDAEDHLANAFQHLVLEEDNM